jgi:hypothetical protein
VRRTSQRKAAEASEERSARQPRCDRGRQRSVRPVRLPQPMGAGSQQPLGWHSRPVRPVPSACCAGQSRLKLSRRNAVPSGAWSLAARTAGPRAGNRQHPKRCPRRRARPRVARPGREAGQGASTWTPRRASGNSRRAASGNRRRSFFFVFLLRFWSAVRAAREQKTAGGFPAGARRVTVRAL